MSKKSRNRYSNPASGTHKVGSNTRSNKGRRSSTSFQWWWIVAAIAVIVIIIGGVWILQPKTGQAEDQAGTEITVAQAYEKYQQGVFLLDVRTQQEWEDYHAPNTTLIPLDQLANRVNELPKDQEIVVVCRSGNRSQEGRDILSRAGFTNVTSMAGGLSDWRSAGYPTVSGP